MGQHRIFDGPELGGQRHPARTDGQPERWDNVADGPSRDLRLSERRLQHGPAEQPGRFPGFASDLHLPDADEQSYTGEGDANQGGHEANGSDGLGLLSIVGHRLPSPLSGDCPGGGGHSEVEGLPQVGLRLTVPVAASVLTGADSPLALPLGVLLAGQDGHHFRPGLVPRLLNGELRHRNQRSLRGDGDRRLRSAAYRDGFSREHHSLTRIAAGRPERVNRESGAQQLISRNLLRLLRAEHRGLRAPLLVPGPGPSGRVRREAVPRVHFPPLHEAQKDAGHEGAGPGRPRTAQRERRSHRRQFEGAPAARGHSEREPPQEDLLHGQVRGPGPLDDLLKRPDKVVTICL